MQPIRITFPVLFILAASLSACATQPHFTTDQTRELLNHVVVVDPDGHPLNPADNRRTLDSATIPLDDPRSPFHDQVAGIMNAIDAAAAQNPRRSRRILIYIHGGMNTLDDARTNALRAYQAMQADPDARDIYPILIDWQSDFLATYAEEMRFIRQGSKDRNLWSRFAAPLFVLSNFASGVAEAPIVWLNLAGDDWQTCAAALSGWNPADRHDSAWDNPRLDNAARFFNRLNDRYLQDRGAANTPPTQIAVSVGRNRIGAAEWALRGVSYTLTIPVKLATGPIINGLGKPSWENMRRRTSTMFESPDAFETRGKTDRQIDDALDHGEAGAVSCLLYELAKKAEADFTPGLPRDVPPPPADAPANRAGNPHYEITIVAHSMGAIVANNILSRFPHLPIKNIVYMGAACTINDMRSTVVPFMQAHPDAQFYNLSLHPVAETLDTEAMDFVPRGSLLVWIDSFLENPRTPLDRTLGRWENIVEATYVFPQEIRGRVHIKSFDLLPMTATPAQRRLNPQMHGDFSHSDFWVPTFWHPAPPIEPQEPLYQQLKQMDQKAAKPSPQAGSAHP